MTSIAKLMDLKGRVALVTGATGGIGKVIVHTLAELGADLLLVDRPNSDFDSLIQSLSNWGVNVETYFCDLEQEEQRHALLKSVIGSHTKLNVLVNNAAFVGASALQGWITSFEEQSLQTWGRAMEVNLTAVFDLCKGFSPLLRASEGASIVNIASIYGHLGPDWSLYAGTNMGNPAAYAASKGGVLQLTRWLATTMAPRVRVNAISPGGVFRNQPDAFVRKYEKRTPLARMAIEDDFRGALAFLASDLSAYVTGHNLQVDGGWSCW